MYRFLPLVFVTALLLLPHRVAAQTPGAIVDTLTGQLALDKQLAATPDNIRSQFEANPLQISSSLNKQLMQTFREAFADSLLLNDFKEAFRRRMEPAYGDTIARWLDRPATRAITAAEQEFYTLQGKRKRVITMYELEQNPPSEARTRVIAAIDDTTSAAGSTVESSVIILRSVIRAVSQASPQRSFSDAQVDMIVDNFRTQLQAQAGPQLQNKLMITYHNLDTDTLRQYLQFWQTYTGQWLDHAVSQSMQAAYGAAADRFLKATESL